MANIYLASSWRNKFYFPTLEALRGAGHTVYDFRHDGFAWTKIGLDPDKDPYETFIKKVDSEPGWAGFHRDMAALNACTHCVLLLPSGRSAHLEAGWAKGSGRQLSVYIPEYDGPDLMWLMADQVTDRMDQLLEWLEPPRSLMDDTLAPPLTVRPPAFINKDGSVTYTETGVSIKDGSMTYIEPGVWVKDGDHE